MQGLARFGFGVEVLCGTLIDAGAEGDPADVLTARGIPFEVGSGGPPHLRLAVEGVPVTIHRRPVRRYQEPEPTERDEFLGLLDAACDRSRPDVLITYGGDDLERSIVARCHRRGMATVFLLHNFGYRHFHPFAEIDAVLVASQFSARFHREALGLRCIPLPYLVDQGRAVAPQRVPRYVTFVNPAIEKGAYAFARIADELGRVRPDIPLLVVEGRGTAQTLAACGIDPHSRGNVTILPHTPDPREFWGLTGLCLLPSLWWENQPLVAIEAMMNGIPVIGSDRGGIPETLGEAGVLLPLPARLTPATRFLPTAEEVAPWVEAIVQLWDDPRRLEELGRRALVEARRWSPEVVEAAYIAFFGGIQTGPRPLVPMPGRSKSVALVLFGQGIDVDCERALQELERSGVRVVRSQIGGPIDLARSVVASEAIHDGFESLLFIDGTIGFEAQDALRMLARPEPVVAGIYPKVNSRGLSSVFADGIGEVVCGFGAEGLYPLRFAAAGFLRVKVAVLRRLVDELNLPLCNTQTGRGSGRSSSPRSCPSPRAGSTTSPTTGRSAIASPESRSPPWPIRRRGSGTSAATAIAGRTSGSVTRDRRRSCSGCDEDGPLADQGGTRRGGNAPAKGRDLPVRPGSGRSEEFR